MTYGIIADVHGNLPALIAVLRALRAAAVDRVLCLGDIVGYNADPDRCVRLLVELGIESIAGNHDLIAAGRLGFDRCAVRPAHALRRTRTRLSAETRAYLGALPPSHAFVEGFALTHGALDDATTYLVHDHQILTTARALQARHPGVDVCFFGHTHEPLLAEISGDRLRRHAPEGVHRLAGGQRYFVNPGSVDASRKEEKLAQMAIYRPEHREVQFLSVTYDDALVERRAARQGYRIGRLRLRWRETSRWLKRTMRSVLRRVAALFGRGAAPC